ncbi:MAG: 3-oxoacid CoA-transferase subunit B [Dehalococcoidia bacterium]
MTTHPTGLPRELIALRVAHELRRGMVVNLGIGVPTLVPSHLPEDHGVLFQSENGILGLAGIDASGAFDPEVINAGGQPITLVPGASFFDSALSFSMIRGGHVDVSVLGGLQVASNGDLANWMVPERGGGSMGGAMDLASGAKRLIVAMDHVTRDGASRLMERCTYPLTAQACTDLVVTNLAVIEVTSDGFLLRETAPGVTVEQVVAATDAPLAIAPDVREMRL